MIQDRKLAEQIMKKVSELRRHLVDAVGHTPTRQEMDELLCKVWLLAKKDK
jgi:hypothetical protein